MLASGYLTLKKRIDKEFYRAIIIAFYNCILRQEKDAGKRLLPTEGVILSGVPKKEQDCIWMALWRIPQRVPKV